MRTEEEQKLYLERQRADFFKSATRAFEFDPGDLLVQTGGAEHHPKWFALNPRRYLGAGPGGVLLYLGVSWQLLDANSQTWGPAHEFYRVGDQNNYFILEYPSYLRGNCFTKIVGTETEE
jgi:hypothetical protein